MAELIINRVSENLFEHILDGVQSTTDNNPNLTAFQNLGTGEIVLHFKTRNGAPLVKNQEIHPSDITVTDTFGGEPDVSGFTTSTQVYDYLETLGYFIGYGGSGGGIPTAQFFKSLSDVFPANTYVGQNGKVYVVNEAENRLEATYLYNFRLITQHQDVENTRAEDIPNGYVLTVVAVIDENGVTQKMFGFRPQSIMSQTPNGFITLGTFELTDGVFTADTAWSWSQDGVQYGNLQEYEYTIEDLPDGSSRFYVFHTQPNDNSFSVTAGVISTDGNALKPQIPLGAIELTTIFVNGSTISEPTEPIIGADYITKKSFGWTTKNITGSNTFLTITDFTNAYNIVNNALVSIDGVQTTGLPNTLEYDGQLIWIKNGSTTTFVLNANVDDFNLMPFKFPTSGNFTMAVGSVACFKRFSNTMELISYNISGLSGVPTLDQVTVASGNNMTEKIIQTVPSEVSGNGFESNRTFESKVGFGENGFYTNLGHIRTNGGTVFGSQGRFEGNVATNFITFSFNTPNLSNGIAYTGSTQANKLLYYGSADGTPVISSFTDRQIPDANWVNAGLALKANLAGGNNFTGAQMVAGRISSENTTADSRINIETSGANPYIQGANFADNTAKAITINRFGGFVGLGKFSPDVMLDVVGDIKLTGLVFLGKYTTGTEPAYQSGAMYFNTSINKLKVGGASTWEVYNAIETARSVSATISSPSATYQNNALIGATNISMVVLNGDITQGPFTFNSTTGTITMAVMATDLITVYFNKN